MERQLLDMIAPGQVPALDAAAEQLVAFTNATGQAWGVTSYDKFWYRSPQLHIVEFVVFHLFVLLCFRLSRGYFAEVVTARRPTVNPKSLLDELLGVAMVACYVIQVTLKSLRPKPSVQLFWMVMPCHLITLTWAYVLLSKGSKNYHFCVYLATLCGAFHWGPVSAAALPDWEDHRYFIEGPLFYAHHALLVVMPFYYAARYAILPLTPRFLAHVTAVATFINVGPYTVLSYATGLNINYHLHPPPKVTKFMPESYRWTVIPGLILLTTMFMVLLWAFAIGARFVARVVFGVVPAATALIAPPVPVARAVKPAARAVKPATVAKPAAPIAKAAAAASPKAKAKAESLPASKAPRGAKKKN
jgi:hypothetical protein